MSDAPARHAVVLFAHGSRDPAWSRPVQAVAESVRRQSPGTPVTCAYLELTEPSLPDAVAALMADAPRAPQVLKVFPLFLGVGRHAREDLPRLLDELRLAWPQLRIELLPSAGEDVRVIELLAQIATG